MDLSPKMYQVLVRPSWATKRYIHQTVLDHFRFEGKAVLDFGAGIGSNCTLFGPDKYVGLDPDHKRIEFAKRLHPNYRFQYFPEDQLPVQDRSIDYVFIIAVLHHIPEPQLCVYLHEFKRVLKPHGMIIVMEPCFTANRHVCNWFMGHFDKGSYIRSEDSYVNLFENNAYVVNVLGRFKKCYLYHELFFSAQLCTET